LQSPIVIVETWV